MAIQRQDAAQERQPTSMEAMARLINSEMDIRNKAVITLLAKTGILRNELITLDIDDVDLVEMRIKLKPEAKGPTGQPLDEYIENDIKKIVIDVWQEFTPAMANDVFKTLKDGMAQKLEERRLEITEFNKHIRTVCDDCLDLFEILLEICSETGMLFNEKVGPHVTS